MSGLIIRSGKVHMGLTGIPTGAVDMHDKPLFTGDIVLTFTERNEQVDYISKLTVVVQDKQSDLPEFFVMGIRSVPLDGSGEWRVLKLKDHTDVVAGEQWPDWGFNFVSAEASA